MSVYTIDKCERFVSQRAGCGQAARPDFCEGRTTARGASTRPVKLEQQEPVFARLPSENELSKTSCDHAPVTFFLNSIRIEISAGCPAELLASLVSVLKSYA